MRGGAFILGGGSRLVMLSNRPESGKAADGDSWVQEPLDIDSRDKYAQETDIQRPTAVNM